MYFKMLHPDGEFPREAAGTYWGVGLYTLVKSYLLNTFSLSQTCPWLKFSRQGICTKYLAQILQKNYPLSSFPLSHSSKNVDACVTDTCSHLGYLDIPGWDFYDLRQVPRRGLNKVSCWTHSWGLPLHFKKASFTQARVLQYNQTVFTIDQFQCLPFPPSSHFFGMNYKAISWWSERSIGFETENLTQGQYTILLAVGSLGSPLPFCEPKGRHWISWTWSTLSASTFCPGEVRYLISLVVDIITLSLICLHNMEKPWKSESGSGRVWPPTQAVMKTKDYEMRRYWEEKF